MDLAQDGHSCTARWLSIVIGTKLGAFVAQSIGITPVHRFVMLFAKICKMGFKLVSAAQWVGISQESGCLWPCVRPVLVAAMVVMCVGSMCGLSGRMQTYS